MQSSPIIRGSLTRHAARDLKEADPDQAVSLRPLLWLTGAVVVLVVVQGVWLIASPAQVLSLLKRAYLPFERHAIAARTELTLVKPDGPEISEEEHEMVLHEEEPVVEKRAVPKKRVRLEKDVVTEERGVSEQVRKEKIEADDPDTIGER